MYIHSSYVLLFKKKGSHEKQEKGAYQVRRSAVLSDGWLTALSFVSKTHHAPALVVYSTEPMYAIF
jgi:hypothetical protein